MFKFWVEVERVRIVSLTVGLKQCDQIGQIIAF